ncbi:MAG: hypothetical protein KAH00_04285, partial [Cocleimonas sp.]|nr:hypothetical protein [Cocleimonas sp.]
QSLVALYKDGRISKDEAAENATSRNNLEWRINFEEKSSGNSQIGNQNEASSFTDSGSHLPELEI